jgi:hypothetical protein
MPNNQFITAVFVSESFENIHPPKLNTHIVSRDGSASIGKMRG